MRWIIFACLIGCSGSHGIANGDDDGGGTNDAGSGGGGDGGGDNGGSGSCGGLSRSWLATGQGPSGIASGDFDRDGILDLAVANTLDHTVSVMRGLGGGRYAPKVDYPTGGGHGLAIADFDHDGKLDLVTESYLLRGNDDGSFQTDSDVPVSGTVAMAGDFDADGNADVVEAGGGYLSIARGRGDGSFIAGPRYELDQATATVIVAIDLNGDGKLDAVVAGPYFIDVFLGHGDGSFGGKLSYPIQTSGYVAVGDVSGDGVPDLVVPGVTQASVYPGMGNGSFGAAVPLQTLHAYPSHVALIDVDHDGTLDIVVSDGETAEIVRSHGDGSYAMPVRLYDEASGPQAWLATDLDGDGQADLALAGYTTDAVSILFADHGAFIAPPSFATAAGTVDVALVDVNGDHHLDAVVLAQTAGTVSILLGAGDGSFATKRDAATGTNPVGFAVQDFDGDGRPDVAVGSYGSINLLRGKGDGGLLPKQDYMPATSSAMVAADFTSDGKPDLVVQDLGGGTLGFLPNAGDGTFATETDLTSVPSYEGWALAAPDLDNNGTPDLAMANTRCEAATGLLRTFAGNGAGGMQALDTITLAHCATSIAYADLDHDGKVDLVVAEVVAGAAAGMLSPVEIFWGTGGGHFHNGGLYPADSAPHHVEIADVDGDGVLDLVVAGTATEILYGVGNGTFGPRTPYGAPGLSAVAADIDGDGHTDVVTTGGSTIQVLSGRCH